MAWEDCSSASAPNVIVPSASSDTIVPLFPRLRSSIPAKLALRGALAYRSEG
ncbi:hypothetical protein GCM10009543_03600 [Leifsonia naganoensis]